MANDLSTIMPKILARGLMSLRERAVMPRLVNSDFSREAAEKGDTITVPLPAAIGTRDVSPSNTPPAPSDVTPPKVTIPLNHWRQTDPFHLTDKQLTEIDENKHFVPMEVDAAITSLAEYVNGVIHDEYKGIYGYVDKTGGIPFNSDVTPATDLRKKLNQQKAPRPNRRAVVDFDAEANALALAAFSDAEKIGSSEVKLEGEIGRKFGFDWAADHAVKTHTAGSLVATVSVDGNVTALPNNLTQDVDLKTDTSGSFNFNVGDIITFAGDSQTYVIKSEPGSVGNSATGQTITVAPGLQSDKSDGDAVTLKGDHTVNLGFHRDAIAFANRPLVDNTRQMARGTDIMSMQDQRTGLVLRLEISRQHKQTVWEFDILFGTKLVRPELAARLAGQA